MSNMTVENISGFMRNGNLEQILDRGRSIEGPSIEAPNISGDSTAQSEKPFTQLLKESVDNLNATQLDADKAVKEMVAGRNKNIHETMLTLEKADMSLRLAMQVRNKIIDAYREVMRMQV